MHLSGPVVLSSFIIFVSGITASFLFAIHTRDLQYRILEEVYLSNSKASAEAMYSSYSLITSKSTLSSVFELEIPTRDRFEYFSNVDLNRPGINNIVILENINTSQIPQIENEISQIYNDTISITPVKTFTSIDSLWFIYYIHPYDDRYVGLDINAIPGARDALKEAVETKRTTFVPHITVVDSDDLGVMTLQPVLGILTNTGILATFVRYRDLFSFTIENFSRSHEQPISVYIEDVKVFSDRIGDTDILVFDTLGFQVYVSKIDEGKYDCLHKIILIFSILITCMVTLVILLLDHHRIEAIEKFRFKSTFISNMSHDAKTPLNGLMGTSELLLQDIDISRELRNSIGTIHACGSSLMRMIDDMIDLSKINCGDLELVEESVNIPDLVVNLVHNIWNVYTVDMENLDKNTDMKLIIHPGIPCGIISDTNRIEHLLRNLIINSMKFTTDGMITITVSSIVKRYIRCINIEITDTGIGIDASIVKQILTGTVGMTKDNGICIGLDLSKKFVDALGFEMSCKSVVGEGTTFNILLTSKLIDGCKMSVDLYEQVFVSDFPMAMDSPLSIRDSQSILIVDDMAVNRMILGKTLENMGMSVQYSVNGKCAYERCKITKFLLILMDLSMPVMNGIESLTHIRTDSLNIDTPAVFVTANTLDIASSAKLAFPGVLIVQKPFGIEHLHKIVKEQLEIRRRSI